MKIHIKESIPGLKEANRVETQLDKFGIHDIRMLFDKEIGMWAVVQIARKGYEGPVLPAKFADTDMQPYIMWWCKDEQGLARVPNDNDIRDAIVVVRRAEITWDNGAEWLENRFKDQDKRKREATDKKQHDRIKAVAPQMKKAIRKELG